MKNSLPVHHATPSILLNILCGAIVLPNFSHEGILRQRRAKKYNPCISCLAKMLSVSCHDSVVTTPVEIGSEDTHCTFLFQDMTDMDQCLET